MKGWERKGVGQCQHFCLSRWQNGSVNYQAGNPGEGARGRGVRDNTHFNLGYFEIHKYVSHPGDQLKAGDLVSKDSFDWKLTRERSHTKDDSRANYRE